MPPIAKIGGIFAHSDRETHFCPHLSYDKIGLMYNMMKGLFLERIRKLKNISNELFMHKVYKRH